MENIRSKMIDIFLELGFEKVQTSNGIFYKYKDTYHRIDYTKGHEYLIIEATSNMEWLQKNLLDDGSMYSLSLGEEEILRLFREDLINVYMKV